MLMIMLSASPFQKFDISETLSISSDCVSPPVQHGSYSDSLIPWGGPNGQVVWSTWAVTVSKFAAPNPKHLLSSPMMMILFLACSVKNVFQQKSQKTSKL